MKKELIGKYVVVRGDRSGVFAGILREKEGAEVLLEDCRKLWYWDGAAAVQQIAVDGVSKPRSCQFTVVVDSMVVLDTIEIIPCTEKAEKSVREVEAWKR